MKNIIPTIFFICSVCYSWGQSYISDFNGVDQLSLNTTNVTVQSGTASFPTSNGSVPNFGNPDNGAVVNNATATITTSSISTNNLSKFTMDLASLSGSSGNGSDGSDYVRIRVSTDGGSSFSDEVEINGNSNAQWTYVGGGDSVDTNYDGDDNPLTDSPSGGGNRDNNDGIRNVAISDIPAGDIVIQIELRNNSGNEYWAVDNLKLKVVSSTCAVTLGTASYECSSMTNGSNNDMVIVNIPYTGTSADITNVMINVNGSPASNTGDDPSMMAGTISFTATEGDAWNVVLVGGDCDGISLSGSIPDMHCDPVCDFMFGTATYDCNTETAGSGNDNVTVTLPYTNQASMSTVTISSEGNTITNTGDDPTSSPSGNITFVIMDGSDWSVSLTGGPCDAISASGTAVICEPVLCPTIFASMINSCGSSEGLNEFIVFNTNSSEIVNEYVFLYGTTDPPSTSSLYGSDATNANPGTGAGSITANACNLIEVTDPNMVIPANSNVVFLPYNYDTPDGYDFSSYCLNGSVYVVYIDIDGGSSNWSPGGNLSNSASTPRYLDIQVNSNNTCSNVVSYIATNLVEFEGSENGATVTWDDSGIATYQNNGCAAPSTLPVTFDHFNAFVEDNNVTLVWRTLAEFNNHKFEIERSNDGISWKKIGERMGKRTTNITQDYQYIDHGLMQGNYYYRLKQIDFDGVYEYSEVVDVFIKNHSRLNASIINEHTIRVSTSESGLASFTLFNTMGMVVSSHDIQLSEGIQEFHETSYLPSGCYILRIAQGKDVVTKKFFIK